MSSFLTLLLCVTGRDGYGAFRHTGTTSRQNAALLLNLIFLQQRRPDSSEEISWSETDVRRFCGVEIRRTLGRSVTAPDGRSRNSSVVLIEHQQTGGRAIKASAWTVTGWTSGAGRG